jgi:hypothetical protein
MIKENTLQQLVEILAEAAMFVNRQGGAFWP